MAVRVLAVWDDFLDCASGVRSVRIEDALTDMRARLVALRGIDGVAELDERAAAAQAR